jgi:predicted acylesterase/phospholipase RssA
MSKLRTLTTAGLIAIALVGFGRPAWTQEGAAASLPSMNAERAAYRSGDAGLVREVRLALVCYGGSSLAIYIHGNTKEVHRLVQASKALQQDATANDGAMQRAVAAGERPGPGEYGQKLTGSTRQWYDRLLHKWLDDRQHVRTRVVVDIIAGTSAGGINGVILAKALAHDLPVDGLTELWLNKASLAKLTNYYFGLLRIFIGRAPVDGDALVGWLFQALNGMDALDQQRGRTPSLLPKGDRLDLFVTATDRFGYPQNLIVGEPASAVETRSRHVLHFVYSGVNRGCDPNAPRLRGEIDNFCPEWTPALAFAARASSSIPGVFPPLNLGDTMTRLSKVAAAGPPPAGKVTPAPLDRVVRSFFRNYELQEPDEKGTFATNTYFVDGGVLDNHPFGPAIEAILSRPQDQEVQRFLIYLQPDPGTPPAGLMEKPKNPGLLKTVWAGLSGIPSGQPILDSLNEVAAHNADLDRIQGIVQAEELAARNADRAGSAGECKDLERLPIAQRFGCALGFEPGSLNEAMRAATQSDLRTVRRKLETAAEKGFVEKESTEKREAAAGLDATGRSYINLRVRSVLAQFVTVIAGSGGCDYPEETAHRYLVAKIIDGWGLDQKLIGQQDDPEAQRAQAEAQRRFLEDFDIGYQRRQLRFVVDWINDQYKKNPPAAKRQILDALKSAAADRIEDLSDLVRGTSLDPDLRRELDALGPLFCGLRPWQLKDGRTEPLDRQAEVFLADPGHQAALAAIRGKLGVVMNRLQQQVRDRSFEDFKRLARDLTPDEQKEILVRYLGFPFWDRQIYPYIAFSSVGELRDIDIYRLSPNDATLLGRRTAAQKLIGAKAAHFGAFLSRPGRESDYLWGRLDAGDRLLDMLGFGPGGAKALFSAIVEEERAVGLIRPSILAARAAEIAKLP